MTTDEQIRAGLSAYADQVEPGPEAWETIRDGVARKRRLTWWVRGSVAATMALALVAGVAIVRLDGNERTGLERDPRATSGPVDPSAPVAALWPFRDRGGVEAWKVDHGDFGYLTDAGQTARRFVDQWIGSGLDIEMAISLCMPTQPCAGTTPFLVRRDGVDITAVYISREGEDGPWLVRYAKSERIRVEAPSAATQTSPMRVLGTTDARDDVVMELQFVQDGSHDDLATASATPDASGRFDTTMEFTERGPGALVIRTPAPVEAVAIVPVTLGPVPKRPGVPDDLPQTFVAAQAGRIGVFDSVTGRLVRYVSPAGPGSAYDPSLSDDTTSVAFTRSEGTCASSIWRANTDGTGSPERLVSSADGAVSRVAHGGPGIAFLLTRCKTGGSQVDLMWQMNESSAPRVVEANVGTVLGQISWVNSRFLVFVAERDGVRRLHSVDSTGELADNATPAEPGCVWQAAIAAQPSGDTRGGVVTAQTCNRGGRTTTAFVRLDADNLNPTPLFEQDRAVSWIDLDGGNGYLLYQEAGASGAIERVDITGKFRTRITQGPQSPGW